MAEDGETERDLTCMVLKMRHVTDGAEPCPALSNGQWLMVNAAAAKKAGLSCVLIDRGAITDSLLNYPYYMTFFSTASLLEIEGVPFTIPEPKPTRREALAYYRYVVEHWDLDVRQYQHVEGIAGSEGDFTVGTVKSDGSPEVFQADAVIIATGGFHAPNFLGVPGEDLPKVRHYYYEPYPYYDQDVLVVGAGNSAVEAALEMFRNGARVTLVHFLDKIDRGVKPWVVPDINNRLERGEIPVHWHSRVAEIRPKSVLIRNDESGEETELANDFVVAMTGWLANHVLLKALGVQIDADTAIPAHDTETMVTNVPGVYIAGVIAAGHNANKIFIENGRHHGGLIVADRLAGGPAD